MRHLVIAAVVLAGAFSAQAATENNAVSNQGYGLALVAGDHVPPIRTLTLEGKPFVVAWAASKLTLVNFWATWCTPCRQEMPELQAIQDAGKGTGLRVVGVVVQDRPEGEPIAKAVNDARVRYEILWGGPDVEKVWRGVSVLPTTFLVDAEGRIVRKYIGTTPDEIAAVKKDIADFLAGRPLGDPYLPPSDPVPESVRPRP
jgi:thiol-disulfide isomerase/thioredoxin